MEGQVPIGSTLAELTLRWDGLKTLEAERQSLVEMRDQELFRQLSVAVRDNDSLRDKVKDLKHVRDTSATENRKLSEVVKALEGQKDASPFVLVLIDGDSTLFLDKYVEAGAQGGGEAAQHLNAALEKNLKKLPGWQAHWRVIIRVIFNRKGLVKAYADARVVSSKTAEDFVMGFNRELPLVEYVDAGSEKEAADNKIKENMTMFWQCLNCKHLVLAASADQSYLNFLRRFPDTQRDRERLTLVESVPFPESFRQFAPRFQVERFPNIFRDNKIEVLPRPSAQSAASPSGTATYAATAAEESTLSTPWRLPTTTSNGQHPRGTPTTSSSSRIMSFNRHGQRIDDNLPPPKNEILARIGQEHYCNRFFLSRCNKSSASCAFRHDGQLSEDKLASLKRFARQRPCFNGTKCEDQDCVAAHQCIYGAKCYDDTNCKYGAEMHGVDKTVVRTVRC